MYSFFTLFLIFIQIPFAFAENCQSPFTTDFEKLKIPTSHIVTAQESQTSTESSTCDSAGSNTQSFGTTSFGSDTLTGFLYKGRDSLKDLQKSLMDFSQKKNVHHHAYSLITLL